MFANRLDENLVAAVLEKARQSPRKRANHCFHQAGDRVQRMVNVALSGSYFAPHKHQDPDKLEIFTIVKGSALVIAFTNNGEVAETVRLDEAGPVRQVEIPPRVWHALAVLSPEAVLYEVIDGHYDAATHKRFAPWAPPEGDAAAPAYLSDLLRRCGAG